MQEYGETNKRWLPLISRVWVRYVAASLKKKKKLQSCRCDLIFSCWKGEMNPNSFYIQPQPGNRYFPGPGPVVISAAAGYQRPQLDTVPAEGTSDEPQTLIKPSCSYSCLIGIALLSSPTGCLPVNEIYKSIE